ncbi:ATPase AAA [Desulfosarcina widdelii]|uniref:ATPase AAA n=1 Tax=Desulfosarcina widdelii TaxID=947919 RepID=A0A5K7ZB26_9BACT|nr:sigma 54-interacting transcriptional regulator [Desulfosarcina widdelii]BBO79046.1 ATPase AAA [Desulfosarcina widdelii]
MIDENEFFRNITLKICGNLEIEEGLHACIQYLFRHMPADVIYLDKYERDLGAIRYIARANLKKGERMNMLVPVSSEAMARAAADLNNILIIHGPVFIINDSEATPIARDLVRELGHPPSSIIGIMLNVGGQHVGVVLLAAEGANRFNKQHAKLFGTLKEPFFVAMSNTLKHREVLKLKDLLADDNRYLQGELRRMSGDEIIGANFGLKQVMSQVQQVAALNSPVLLLGETGTGKDVIANTIHYSSARSDGPFVSVNCGAIPDSLIDSELFGHEKGAFTGALSQKRGRFERADKGTIFLDEIGELPPAAQVRLLRVLQSREIERVGGVKTIPLDIRIIAATNRNLEEMVKNKRFREDLWFRLNVFPVSIPPLRRRTSDIPALVRHFIKRKAKELKLGEIPDLAPGAIEVLMSYEWPGNVRELENLIERSLILHRGKPIRFDDLVASPAKQIDANTGITEDEALGLDAIVKKHIERALEKANGKIHGPGGAGELLGVNPNTLRYKMKKLGIPFRKQKK